MVDDEAVRDGHGAPRPHPLGPPHVLLAELHGLDEPRQLHALEGPYEGAEGALLGLRPGLRGQLRGLGQAAPEPAEEHAQEHNVHEVGVVGHRVPAVQRQAVEGQGHHGVLLVAWQGLEEAGLRREPREPLGTHGDHGPELVLLALGDLAAALELRLVEVPDRCDAISSAAKVLLHRPKLADREAVGAHLVAVLHRVGEGLGGHEVHVHVPEDLEAVDLGVRRPAVQEVPD
mmetsp:Transcript_65551/g.211431  ORF Transcript_65551/g.211431 Transcript_65551/m.211431 type:complete len:231 (-) Transcript_65551:655-1347(-)